jgi:hypothetical protein
MNYIDPLLPKHREAQVRFLDGEFQVLKAGEFVRCGITGEPIPVHSLRYWSVDRQIAYKDARTAFADMYR